MIGKRVAHYEVTTLLGEGGMGQVYQATDTKLKREVALKILPESFAADPHRMARFQREAEVLASLNHPNIAAIHGLEQEGSIHAIAMELVEGETLAARIQRGALPLEEALQVAMQITQALEAAHERGIIHRDLKPANVIVTPAGKVKVLDFGLAKPMEAAPPGDASHSPTLTLQATQAGMLLGTAAYMAPEQARGKAVDKRTDIWAFGVVLYEMVTGRKLFAGEDLTDTLARVVRDEPDLSMAPPELRPLLEKCLEKDPKKRLRDISGVELLLDAGRAAESVRTSGAGEAHFAAKSRVTGVLVLAVIVLAIAATLFAALWLQPAPLPEVTRFLITAPPGSTLPLGTPAPSPDGKLLAYTVTGPDGMTRIHVRRMDRTDSRELPGTEGAVHPFWSPDGRSLAFAANRELKRIDVDAGSPRVLAEGVTGNWHGDWGAQGDILLNLADMARVSAQGASEPEELQIPGGHPFFLPDGERFLFRSANFRSGNGIHLARLGSTETRVVREGADSAPLLAQTPRGETYLLYLVGPDLSAVEFDADWGTVIGEPFIVIPNIGTVASPAVRPAVGVSRSGVLAYQNQAGGASVLLSLYDRSGDVLRELPEHAAGANPRFSPDGSMLAVTRDRDLWVTDLARGSSNRITFDVAGIRAAAWAPEGDRLAVSSFGERSSRIVRIDGTGEEEGPPTDVLSWISDDRILTFTTEEGLTVKPLMGDSDAFLLGVKDIPPQGELSPDGQFVAFASRASGKSEIYVRALPPGTGQTKISISGGERPRWNGDGTELFFIAPGGILMAVDTEQGDTFKAGLPHELFTLSPDTMGYDISLDGQSFAIATRGGSGSAGSNDITVVLNWWVEVEK